LDKVVLEEITARNVIDARWFLPFLVHRLQSDKERTAVLAITLYDVLEASTSKSQLELTWGIKTETILPIQEHTITEWAAYGIACVLIPLYTAFKVKQVTQLGEGFDYWIGNDEQEFGLEISGTLAEDIVQRHRNKIWQFKKNPLQISGYVNVTGFQEKHSILSFHQIDQYEVNANE
jgi:hypothetical protein